ncbi:hypothetical protein F4553_006542 [Allocatelliglobosispora scoriae]|uniref:NRDE family protein n=1 Tax=Allocatelliglobosispora scoriae TaxID=643052 RepID=A0A841C037_9ACTN|nr:NRDE family protein [Allocatelliglobosispora scoriae]MBB5873108.1 hypothetical protein [Allocatelliglobosispora scoriae]
MCIVVASIEPEAEFPLLVLAIRDEMLDRPWLPPAEHWPDRPGVLGGRDLLSGGTWLAVDPAAPRIACVLNSHSGAPGSGRLSRGSLPLTAVAGEPLPRDLSGFAPFYLLDLPLPGDGVANDSGARLVGWNGTEITQISISPGTTIVANAGLDPTQPRVERLRALLARASRPEPQPDQPPERAWRSWLDLLALPDLDPAGPAAIVRRLTVAEDRPYGSNSISLLAASSTHLRYDFITVVDPPLPLTGAVTVLAV